ncbi:MAG: MFS transporter [Chloroflexi bacterium]|nr:MFS transporter [Chloroflexota bacterium]
MPRYLEVLGASAWVIGAYGSLQRVVDALYQYPGGAVSDRLGRKRALVLFNMIAAAESLPDVAVFLNSSRLLRAPEHRK